MQKKLQIFVSSTYTDLVEERQAAVQAILNAGHIPAGMELFTAGSQSQLETIYKWIDDSDVYMLILGGRYGSIEPKSGKSYTQLEYEYAVSHNIPIFSLVLSDDFINEKIKSSDYRKITETIYPDLHNKFKSSVLNRIVEFVNDQKDIQLGVFKSLNTIQLQYELRGWIRSDSIPDLDPLFQQLKSLNSENATLKSQLSNTSSTRFGDYTFDQLQDILSKKMFEFPEETVSSGQPFFISALDFFFEKYGTICTGMDDSNLSPLGHFLFYKCFPFYDSYGLMRLSPVYGIIQRYQISDLGRKFYTHFNSSKLLQK